MIAPPVFIPSSCATRPLAARREADRLLAQAHGVQGPERHRLLARAAVAEATAIRARWADAWLFARISLRAPGGSAGQTVGWLATAGEVRRELAACKAAYRQHAGHPMSTVALPAPERAHPQTVAESWGEKVHLTAESV